MKNWFRNAAHYLSSLILPQAKKMDGPDKLPVTVYLDFNIINAIEKGKITKEQVAQLIGAKNILYCYSDAHLYETDTMTSYDSYSRENVIQLRLETIGSITGNLYCSPTDGQMKLVTLAPEVRYKEIKDYPEKQTINQGFAGNMPLEYRKLYRDKLQLDPNVINNLPPDKIFDYLDQKYKAVGLSIDGTIKQFVSDMGGKVSLYDKMAFVFLLLDLGGFYKDKETDKSDFARMWDTNHATYASYCDYFISNDKRTRMKAAAAYHYLGTQTKILAL